VNPAVRCARPPPQHRRTAAPPGLTVAARYRDAVTSPARTPPSALPPTPRWALVPAALAPVGMIGGWTLAAALAPGFDPARETISALATARVEHPGVMTAGLVLTGLAHVGTAVGLRPAAQLGRVLLAVGGLGALAVAAFPADVAEDRHGLAAAIAFAALSVWPLGAWRRAGAGATRRPGGRPAVLAPATSVVAALALLALLAWFDTGVPQVDGESLTGLSERAVAGAQALWPLVVVLGTVRPRSARTPRLGGTSGT